MYTHDRRVTYSEISMKDFADIAQVANTFRLQRFPVGSAWHGAYLHE